MSDSVEEPRKFTDQIIKPSDQQLERHSADAEEFEMLTQEGFIEGTLLL